MPETRKTFCRICESLCGLEVDVENGRPVDVRPDPEHVATQGYGCVKGLQQHQMYGSRDRVRRPLQRVGNDYQEVSWEHALTEIGRRVKTIRRQFSDDSVAMYVGTAAGFSVLHPIFAQGFMTGIGSKNMYASATQDCSNKFAVSSMMYGFPFTQPFPDVDNTDCLIVVGANPAISKWSFLQVSNPIQRLKSIERRGASLVFVDPRRTESARVAGEHVFIRPGTDVFFYLSFLREVLSSTDGIDRKRVRRYMKGFSRLEALTDPWPAERTATVTGIPAETLRQLVSTYLSANRAALYSSTGVNMGRHGALCFWLQEVINAVTGNLDRRGGTLVGRGIIDFAAFGKKTGALLRPDRSRIGGFQSVNDAFPGGILADEILTPGKRQIRALFVTGGNPVMQMANSGRLEKAFESLDLLVTLDIYLNETGSLADFVLPATSPFERPDLPFVFPLLLGMQSRPYLQATEAVVQPDGEQRDEATIYTLLARYCGTPLFGSRIFQKLMEAGMAVDALVDKFKDNSDLPSVPQRLLLDLLLRITGHGSFSGLLSREHGRRRPPNRGEDFLGKRVVTDDGLVDLAPDRLVKATGKLESFFENEQQDTSLKLITRRAVRTHNSWTHNHAPFVKDRWDRNYLYMHPDDAAERGLEDGDLADVATDTGKVRLPVSLLSDLMPGTVALPHGWGHQHARGLSVASQTRGVNVNLLAADGPDEIDPVSGMAHLTAIPVDVTPAAGPADTSNWSGIPSSA